MKTPKKTFEKNLVDDPISSKNSANLAEEDPILSNKIIEDDDFNLPLDDLEAFDTFDDDDEDY